MDEANVEVATGEPLTIEQFFEVYKQHKIEEQNRVAAMIGNNPCVSDYSAAIKQLEEEEFKDPNSYIKICKEV